MSEIRGTSPLQPPTSSPPEHRRGPCAPMLAPAHHAARPAPEGLTTAPRRGTLTAPAGPEGWQDKDETVVFFQEWF